MARHAGVTWWLPPATWCFFAGWIILFSSAGFLWSAVRQAPLSGSVDGEDDVSDVLPVEFLAAKPSFCRQDMPGCIPQDIQHVFWLSSPESGQDVVQKFVMSQSGPSSAGMQLAVCNLAGALADLPYCLSATGEHHTPEVREEVCRAQMVAMGLLQQQPFFQRLRCNFAVGQYDFSLLYTLPREMLERTLIVFSARDPVQQAAAVHRVFSQLDPERMCPGTVHSPGAPVDLSKCTKLSDFVRRGFAGAHPADALVKRLAGDYCCYQSELFGDDEARIHAAVTNFLRVGVVIDSSDLSSGMQYLAHVLGWDAAEAVPPRATRLPMEKVPSEEQRKVRKFLQREYSVYNVVRQRLSEQAAYFDSGAQAEQAGS